jgi:hypothetical protein
MVRAVFYLAHVHAFARNAAKESLIDQDLENTADGGVADIIAEMGDVASGGEKVAGAVFAGEQPCMDKGIHLPAGRKTGRHLRGDGTRGVGNGAGDAVREKL